MTPTFSVFALNILLPGVLIAPSLIFYFYYASMPSQILCNIIVRIQILKTFVYVFPLKFLLCLLGTISIGCDVGLVFATENIIQKGIIWNAFYIIYYTVYTQKILFPTSLL